MTFILIMESYKSKHQKEVNVFGTELQPCNAGRPKKKYFEESAMRDGYCYIPKEDERYMSKLMVCAEMTEDFLEFSKNHGTDFRTPDRRYDFPGLSAGDRWCICARKWAFALAMKQAPPIKLTATHKSLLTVLDMEDIKSFDVS